MVSSNLETRMAQTDLTEATSWNSIKTAMTVTGFLPLSVLLVDVLYCMTNGFQRPGVPDSN